MIRQRLVSLSCFLEESFFVCVVGDEGQKSTSNFARRSANLWRQKVKMSEKTKSVIAVLIFMGVAGILLAVAMNFFQGSPC